MRSNRRRVAARAARRAAAPPATAVAVCRNVDVAPSRSILLAIAAAMLGIAMLAGCSGHYGNADSSGNGLLWQAFAQGQSHVVVTVTGSIAKDLGTAPGPQGPAQTFLLHLTGGAGHGLTVRVQNDLSQQTPIPLREGDSAEVRGTYVYAQDGGTIFDADSAPNGEHAPGYVKIGDHTYR